MLQILNTCNFSTSYKEKNQQLKKFKQFYHDVFKIFFKKNLMDTTTTILCTHKTNVEEYNNIILYRQFSMT